MTSWWRRGDVIMTHFIYHSFTLYPSHLLLRLCSMREDSLLSFPYAISFVLTTCFTCTAQKGLDLVITLCMTSLWRRGDVIPLSFHLRLFFHFLFHSTGRDEVVRYGHVDRPHGQWRFYFFLWHSIWFFAVLLACFSSICNTFLVLRGGEDSCI